MSENRAATERSLWNQLIDQQKIPSNIAEGVVRNTNLLPETRSLAMEYILRTYDRELRPHVTQFGTKPCAVFAKPGLLNFILSDQAGFTPELCTKVAHELCAFQTTCRNLNELQGAYNGHAYIAALKLLSREEAWQYIVKTLSHLFLGTLRYLSSDNQREWATLLVVMFDRHAPNVIDPLSYLLFHSVSADLVADAILMHRIRPREQFATEVLEKFVFPSNQVGLAKKHQILRLLDPEKRRAALFVFTNLDFFTTAQEIQEEICADEVMDELTKRFPDFKKWPSTALARLIHQEHPLASEAWIALSLKVDEARVWSLVTTALAGPGLLQEVLEIREFHKDPSLLNTLLKLLLAEPSSKEWIAEPCAKLLCHLVENHGDEEETLERLREAKSSPFPVVQDTARRFLQSRPYDILKELLP